MAMTAGTTALEAGSMAKAIYDELDTQFGSVSGSLDTDRKKFCAAVAKGVVDHITAHADVTITTSDGALQQVTLVNTDPPSADRTLSSAVS